MRSRLSYALAFALLGGLSAVMFITLFYYAIYGWSLKLQDARLVAVKETNLFILGFELAFLGAVIFGAGYLFMKELSGKTHNGICGICRREK